MIKNLVSYVCLTVLLSAFGAFAAPAEKTAVEKTEPEKAAAAAAETAAPAAAAAAQKAEEKN